MTLWRLELQTRLLNFIGTLKSEKNSLLETSVLAKSFGFVSFTEMLKMLN